MRKIRNKLETRWGHKRHAAAQEPGASHESPPASFTRQPDAPAPTSAAAIDAERPETSTVPALTSEPTSDPTEIGSFPSRLWMQAYNAIRTDDPELVAAYESILSTELSGSLGLLSNVDSQQSRSQMVQLVESGLEKTQKAFITKQKVQEGMRVVSSVTDLIGSMVKQAPEAAAAWAGVCLLIQVIDNSLSEAAAHREGISYVVSRLDWYWNLSKALFESKAEGLRTELEKHVVSLYQTLLSFQMKSICSLFRKPAAVIWRDTFKIDNWAEATKTVQDAEAIVQRDIDTYNNLEMQKSLADLAGLAKDRNTQLQDIYQTIKNSSQKQNEGWQSEKDGKCLQNLLLSDPRIDKERIKTTKGGLFHGASNWILEHEDFQHWRQNDDTKLLWIKGDPGKGKTMLLITIVEELERELALQPDLGSKLSYFFCQGTNNDLNNATAVLRGLVYQLAIQHPSLMLLLRNEYDSAGSKLFEGKNGVFALSKLLEMMLCDKSFAKAYLVIDALDECTDDREQLIKLVVRCASKAPRVKWVISSRNRPEIEQHLKMDTSGVKLGLEISQNAEQTSRAVNAYIEFTIQRLKSLQDDDDLRKRVRNILVEKASGTYLWVALVVKELEKAKAWRVLQTVEKAPAGLDELYGAMMTQMQQEPEDWELCQLVLSAATIAYRPLHLAELAVVSGLPKSISTNASHVKEIVGMCGSFLTVLEDGVVYIIHQSAKDYLSKPTNQIFPTNLGEAHDGILRQSLEAMKKVLRRDIYSLRAPGFDIEELETPRPDPLEAVRYSCAYWVGHFSQSSGSSLENSMCSKDLVLGFLRQHTLHWLESLSLLGHLVDGVGSVQELYKMLHGNFGDGLTDLVNDLRRFMLHNRWLIENFPLQTYASALIFSPTNSLIRQLFRGEHPKWVVQEPRVESSWSACLQTLETGYGSYKWVESLAFSRDNQFLALATPYEIKVWDAALGTLLRTLQHPEDTGAAVSSMIFSPDGLFMFEFYDGTLVIWDPRTSDLEHRKVRAAGHSEKSIFSPDCKLLALSDNWSTEIEIRNVATGDVLRTLSKGVPKLFSPDSRLLAALGDEGHMIMIWNPQTGVLQHILRGHTASVETLDFSPGGNLLATVAKDWTVRVWDTTTGNSRLSLESKYGFDDVLFSPSGESLILTSDEHIEIWDAIKWVPKQKIEAHRGPTAHRVLISPDGKLLSMALDNRTVKIWNVATGAVQQTLKGHTQAILAFANSSDGTLLASASSGTIHIWDITSMAPDDTLENHSAAVALVTFSPKGNWFATWSYDGIIMIWNAKTGVLESTVGKGSTSDTLIAFSFDERVLVLEERGQVELWSVVTGTLLQTITGASNPEASTYEFTISPDGSLLASTYMMGVNPTTGNLMECGVTIWETTTGAVRQTLQDPNDQPSSITFSPNGRLLACASKTVYLWDTETGECLYNWRPYEDEGAVDFGNVLFSPDGTLLASTSQDDIWIWDTATGVLRAKRDVWEKRLCSLVFSTDGSLLATWGGVNPYYKVRVWDTDTFTLRHTLDIELGRIDEISFNNSNSALETACGRFNLAQVGQAGTLCHPPQAGQMSTECAKPCGYSFDFKTSSWITWNEHKMLWLPPNFRPGRIDVYYENATMPGTAVIRFGIGCGSGRVFIIGLRDEDPGLFST